MAVIMMLYNDPLLLGKTLALAHMTTAGWRSVSNSIYLINHFCKFVEMLMTYTHLVYATVRLQAVRL
jgi:hypothetical protein